MSTTRIAREHAAWELRIDYVAAIQVVFFGSKKQWIAGISSRLGFRFKGICDNVLGSLRL